MTLAACTKYQRKSATGGYSDFPLGNQTHYVSFSGNAYTDEETIVRYWHRRCAEICGGRELYKVLSMGDRGRATQQTSFNQLTQTATTYNIVRHKIAGYIECITPPPGYKPTKMLVFPE